MPAVLIVAVWDLPLKIYCLQMSQRQSLSGEIHFLYEDKASISTKAFWHACYQDFSGINIYSRSEPSLQINLSASVSLSAATPSSWSWQTPLTFVYHTINQALVTDASQAADPADKSSTQLGTLRLQPPPKLSTATWDRARGREALRRGNSSLCLKHQMVVPYLCRCDVLSAHRLGAAIWEYAGKFKARIEGAVDLSSSTEVLRHRFVRSAVCSTFASFCH